MNISINNSNLYLKKKFPQSKLLLKKFKNFNQKNKRNIIKIDHKSLETMEETL